MSIQRHQMGFTILEVLVALALFSIITAAIIPGLIIANKTSLDSGNVLNTTSITQEVVEDVRQKVSTAWAGANDCYKIGRLPDASRLMTTKGNFKIKTEIAPIPTLRSAPGTPKDVTLLYINALSDCTAEAETLNSKNIPVGQRVTIYVYPSNETIASSRGTKVSLDFLQGSL